MLVDDLGRERFYGSECVSGVFSAERLKAILAEIPDLTIRRSGTGPAIPARTAPQTMVAGRDNAAKLAAEYLWLRLDKVTSISAVRAHSLAWHLATSCGEIRNAEGFWSAFCRRRENGSVHRAMRVVALPT